MEISVPNDENNVPLQMKSSETDKIPSLWNSMLSNIPNTFKKSKKYEETKTPEMAGVVTKAMCINKYSNRLLEFTKRPKYKLYSAVPYILILCVIIFIILILYKGSNAIKMAENSVILDDINNNILSTKSILQDLKLNTNIDLQNINKMQKQLDYETSILKEKNVTNNNCIYVDNICDKSIDLCNGIIASILMIYIGSASFRFYQLRRDAEKNNTCDQKSPTNSE